MYNQSLILYNQLDSSQKTSVYSTHCGCSEFPALTWQIKDYISAPIFIFTNTPEFTENIDRNLPILFGDKYNRVDYLNDYVHLVMEMLQPINNKAGKELFQPYDYATFKNEYPKSVSYCNQNSGSGTLSFSVGNISMPKIPDNWLVGIKNNCWDIRDLVKARSGDHTGRSEARCRKVQLAHTALRLIHSNGWDIAMIATKLWKTYSIDSLSALWIAYHIRNVFTRSSSDYGDLFLQDSPFIGQDSFCENFFDNKLNPYVSKHFDPKSNSMVKFFYNSVKYFNSNAEVTGRILTPSEIADIRSGQFQPKLFRMLANEEHIGPKIKSFVDECLRSINIELHKIEFSFKSKLFNSVDGGVKYTGFMIPNSKLERIVFRDDNEVTLSVLKGSKFIKIIK